MAVKFAQHNAKWYYYMEVLKTTAFAIIAFFSFVSAALSEAAASSEHNFEGSWITSDEFARLPKTDMFHRQLDSKRAAEVAAAAKIKNRHILFRKTLSLPPFLKTQNSFFPQTTMRRFTSTENSPSRGPRQAIRPIISTTK